MRYFVIYFYMSGHTPRAYCGRLGEGYGTCVALRLEDSLSRVGSLFSSAGPVDADADVPAGW